MKKATLAGYRHLLRKARPYDVSTSEGTSAMERIREIAHLELGDLIDDVTGLEARVGEMLELTVHAVDGCRLDEAGRIVLPARFDCADDVAADAEHVWAMVLPHLRQEECTDAASLLRVLSGAAMVCKAAGTSISAAADTTLV